MKLNNKEVTKAHWFLCMKRFTTENQISKKLKFILLFKYIRLTGYKSESEEEIDCLVPILC